MVNAHRCAMLAGVCAPPPPNHMLGTTGHARLTCEPRACPVVATIKLNISSRLPERCASCARATPSAGLDATLAACSATPAFRFSASAIALRSPPNTSYCTSWTPTRLTTRKKIETHFRPHSTGLQDQGHITTLLLAEDVCRYNC